MLFAPRKWLAGWVTSSLIDALDHREGLCAALSSCIVPATIGRFGASNRDEMADRPWLPPARHWPDRPEVTAGRDEFAGGSWLGVNDTGLVAVKLESPRHLGADAGHEAQPRQLVLDALDLFDASDAVDMLLGLDAHTYRPFNMVLAGNTQAFWLRNLGASVEAERCRPATR